MTIEIPDVYLPKGVSGARFDPVVLRGAAEAHVQHPFDHNMRIKAWVVLYLLDNQIPRGGLPAGAPFDDPEAVLRIYGLTLADVRQIAREVREWKAAGGRESTLPSRVDPQT